MALDLNKFDFGKVDFSAPTATPEQPSGSSVLPPVENSQTNVAPVEEQPTLSVTDQIEAFEKVKPTFIADTNKRYGIEPTLGRNSLNYTQLNERIRQDGLKTWEAREVQQQWIGSLKKYRDNLPDGEKKESLTKQIEEIEGLPMTLKENTWFNQAKEAFKFNAPAIEAQVERASNAALNQVKNSNTDLLAKYDPELLAKAERMGGVDELVKAGNARNANDSNEDAWGGLSGGVNSYTKEQQEFGKELVAKLANYRSAETLAMSDKEGEEVTLPDGRKVKMSNQQAAQYYEGANSSIASRDERNAAFNEDPFGELDSLDGVKNLFGTSLGSTVRNSVTTLAGTAAFLANPLLGVAVMNSGNVTDQEFSEVNNAITTEYKKLYGQDADPAKMSASEYTNFAVELAKRGVINEASAKGVTTGILMTMAETLVGGAVGSIGAKALAKRSAVELASELKTKLAKAGLVAGGLGLKVSDEGLQEVASTIVENTRTGKKWNDGLTQSFILGSFSVENAVQGVGHSAHVVSDKAREYVESRKAELDTTQATDPTLEQAAQLTDVQDDAKPDVAVGAKLNKLGREKGHDMTTSEGQKAFAEEVKSYKLNREKRNDWNDVTPAGQLSATEKETLFSEWHTLANKNNEELTDVERNRLHEIEDQFSDKDDNNYFIEALNAWERGDFNEGRTDNRDGETDANGQPVEQGTTEPNGSGEERSSQTSEPVSPTETTTATEGHSQSDTGVVADLTEQPHDNTPASDSTGTDGRTGETDSTRGERGKLGETGSEQSGRPTETTRAESASDGVQQRAQSDSVGETLNDGTVPATGSKQNSRPTEQSVRTDIVSNKETTNEQVNTDSTQSQNVAEPRSAERTSEVQSNPAKVELLDKIKQFKGTPTADQVSAFRDEMRDKKLTKDTEVRSAIHKLANKLDDSEFERYSHLEDNKRTARKEQAYKDFAKAISTPYEKSVQESNAKRAAIDNAVASEKEQVNTANEFAKEFKGLDLRQNQKVANKLLAEHHERESDIKQAFFRATPSARDTSFDAAKRGYIKYHKNNPVHKDFSGSKDGLLGFDFNGNPVYTTPEDFFAELQNDDSTQAVVAETIAHAQSLEADRNATIDAAVNNTLRRSQFRGNAKDIRAEAAEVLGKEKVTNEDLAKMATDKETRESVGEKTTLRKFLDFLNKVLASVIAVVAVGSMTVPQDAHAHTGYGTFTNPKVIAGASQKASDTINWVVANKDHGGKSFVVADKENGKILVVSTDGKVLDSQNAIFGKNKGDSNAFGNTPSGRFQLQKVDTKKLTATDRRVFGDSVLDLADKETGKKVRSSDGKVIAMHRVVNLPERKAALESANPSDNFLSHGCINIPTAFYNKAVDNLDGAMVYVLNQEDGKQTKVADNTSNRKQFKRSALKWSVAPKDVKAVNISVDKLQATLDKALGDLSKNVRFVTKEDFDDNGAFNTLRNAGVEGFYDADSKQVYLVADNIKADRTLSAEDRATWVAWHEMFHQGLDVKHGDKLAEILNNASNNPFVNTLANAIRLDRMNNELTEISQTKAVEEALAELGAALETKNLAAIEQRYGVSVPNDFRNSTKSFVEKAVQSIANLVRKILGKPVFSSKQVMALLDEAKQAIVPSKEMKDLAQKELEEMHSIDSAISGAVSFSIADKFLETAKDFRDIVTGGDISRTGSTPARDGSRSAKESAAGQNALSRWWTQIQDSMQIIIDLDPEGNGGQLSNAVATYANRAQQVARSFSKRAKEFEYKMLDFVTENKDLFPKRKNRKQVDHLIQDTTSSLRAITGGNEKIRRNIERTIFGDDIYSEEGEFIRHVPGLLDKKREYEEYLENNRLMNLDAPSYLVAKYKHYAEELEKMVAIQDMFDKSDNQILVPSSENDTSRKNWRGHDGFTTAEAEAKLAQLKEQGFIDEDVSSLTKEPYTVRKYLGLDEETGEPKFEVVTHYRYNTSEVKEKVKGRIMPLAEDYVKLSQDIYAKSVELIGEEILGKATSEEWETGTMGKVRNVYNINAKDSNGNDIDDVYDVTNANNIDQIISRQQAAEYSSRQNGRAFNGGTASENLTWHIQLMSKQYAAKHVGNVMLEMSKAHPDKIKVYKRNTPEYSLQNGILVTRKVEKNGKPETEVVKVSFANEEANRALFGENIARASQSDNLVLRAVPAFLSSLTRLASAGLTMTPGFGILNAYKGYNEKLNQLLAFSANSPFVKAMSPEGRKWFETNGSITDTYLKETKLQAFLTKNKVQQTIMSPLKMFAREKAAVLFAQRLVDNGSYAEKALTTLGSLLPAQRDAVQAELTKLELMYKTGGISSRVEDLINTSTDLKQRFAAGKRLVKVSDAAKAILDSASTVTMSQELVSSLMMYDLLTGTFGMDKQKAIEANLHFMNFNKRGASKIMNYIRNYTMFGNAIAQGAKAFQYAYLEQTNNPDDNFLGILPGYRWSGKGTARMANNVAIALALNMIARAVAENACEDNGKQLGNPISGMNPYQLLRDVPIVVGCSDKGYGALRWPVEYGAGNVENALGVALAQVMTNAWSAEQAVDFVLDSFADNAVPVSIPVAHGGTPFQKAAMVLFPLVPEPLKDYTLAAMGLDNFGNRLNSQVASFKDYKPAAGKKTTDDAWEGVAKGLYDGDVFGLNINLTPEETKVLVTGWTKGIFQDMLTYVIEKEPKQELWATLVGAKSAYRKERGWDKIAYAMSQTYMNTRYQDLTAIAIKAKGLDNTDATPTWLAKNGYELDDDSKKVLQAIVKYRKAVANKKSSQERKFQDNVEFIKTIREIEGIK